MGFLSSLPPMTASPGMSEAVMGFKSVPMGETAKQLTPFGKAIQNIGAGFQQMGQAPQDQLNPVQLPHSDAMSVLRSLGIDLGGNYLGRLGRQ